MSPVLPPMAREPAVAGVGSVSNNFRRRGLIAAGAALAASAGLVFVVASKGHQFTTAVNTAPLLILVAAAVMHLAWLLARCEAWAVCIDAAGGQVPRRRLYRAASLGYLGNVLNPQLGLGIRIAALRRSAPAESPRASVLVAAEFPIVVIEAALAAVMSFTLVAALGLPWWVPIAALATMAIVVTATCRFARDHHDRAWRGLAVMGALRGRSRVVGLVILAVCIQVARNWFVLHAIGVDISIFDSIALLIGMAAIGILPVGPGVGAAACVLILGSNGVASMAAAGALLTVTAVAGAAAFALWALFDRLRSTLPATSLP
ncbi:MAG: hypothetical protein QOF23_1574 [Solirubrobacterales bacterium]|jgi:uncharacterized membrane protein YbhN (UPF0104 family)|nr:hypothetical protein [Solirubrobacterales bacterium]